MNKSIILGKNQQRYKLIPLTKEIAIKYIEEIQQLLNFIENSNSSKEMILSDNFNKQKYTHKWDLSFILFFNEKPVGIFINYLRLYSIDHPIDSLYIHRVSIDPSHQNNGLAKTVLENLMYNLFTNILWLNNITVQATILPDNKIANLLYNKLGFSIFCEKNYNTKKDNIYLLSRDVFFRNFLDKEKKVSFTIPSKKINHLRLPNFIHKIKLYLSTSSKEKQEQFNFLFSLYNLNLEFYKLSHDLIEPQIENANTNQEKLLVEQPLKNASRFVSQRNKIPFLVEDTILYIERFNKDFEGSPELPGLDTKRWWKQLGNEGILDLLSTTNKRKAKYISQFGCYLGKNNYIVSRGETKGTISPEIRTNKLSYKNFPKTNPYFFHAIFIPENSNKTFAEMEFIDFINNDYRRKSLENLLEKLSKLDKAKFDMQTVMDFYAP